MQSKSCKVFSTVPSPQFSSVTQWCLTLFDSMDCSTPGFLPVYHPLPELAQTHVHQFGDATQNHLILCYPLLLLPSTFPSSRVFSSELALCIRWPKYWHFSFSISPSHDYLGLISFRMDWLDLLGVQGILKSPLQHHSSTATILRRSAFFIVQLSHPCMTTGKTILTFWGSLYPGKDKVLKQQTAYLSSVPQEQKLLPKVFQGFRHYWILYLPYWIL